ncbi:MAG: aldo/keto reductase [Thermoproteota archaeon]|nr:aldo/keto reductase [Thermoproteota archaeon]
MTTKVCNSYRGYDSTLRAWEAILLPLELTYMDLYLIHWPVPEMRDATCGVMVRLYDEKSRAIGVSNYEIPDLKELLEIVSLAISCMLACF